MENITINVPVLIFSLKQINRNKVKTVQLLH